MYFFFHKHGYNFFNINRLTYAEINNLMDAHNRDIDKQRKANDKAGKKNKRTRR